MAMNTMKKNIQASGCTAKAAKLRPQAATMMTSENRPTSVIAMTLGHTSNPIRPDSNVKAMAPRPKTSMPPMRLSRGPGTFASQAHMAASVVATQDSPVTWVNSSIMTSAVERYKTLSNEQLGIIMEKTGDSYDQVLDVVVSIK